LRVSKGDVASYGRGIYSTFYHLAEENNISYTYNAPDETLYGWFDKDILEKAINNLLSNAFKYTPRRGEIDVSFSIASRIDGEISRIKILVGDNGKGIPEDQVQYVFDRYYQVENTNTGFNTGTGIGLAYTKELIELHKGEIHVESRIDHGTTFTITLPVHESYYSQNEKSTNGVDAYKTIADDVRQKYREEIIALEQDTIPVQDIGEPSEEDKVMLIVEDNTDLRTFIKSIFAYNYTIIEAPDGIDGLHKAIEFVPDIIISDIMMPGMNGLELCNKLKSNIQTNHIPILILTAKTGEENEIEGFKTGADDYVTKPFNSEILQARIQRLIESKKLLQEYFTREFLLNPKNGDSAPPEDEFLRRTIAVIENNITNPSLDVEMLTKELAVSRTQLFRKLKTLTNYSANQFIRNMKLKKAASLLQQKSHNVGEVVYLSGFNSPSYFTACFKEMYGCLPKEYSSS
jgi:DNA-binding response OmpR family regulator